jgi:hypothetical protein
MLFFSHVSPLYIAEIIAVSFPKIVA